MTLHSPVALVKSTDAYLAFRTPSSGVPVGPVEVEPIVFWGQLWTITGIAPSGAYSGQFRVDGPLIRPLANVNAPDMSYPCAHVEDGVVFVYGVSLDHKRISMMWSTDLINWSSPVVVFTATGDMEFYNTTVARETVSGKYRMAVETHHTASYPSNHFIIHFLSGESPSAWTMTPHIFMNASYVNCPTIRYVGTTLYMLFMEWTGSQHVTFVARSLDDGATWERGLGADGQTAAFVPSANEGNNNSDVALVEFLGKTYFTYGRGDQTYWLECATAVYPGTMKQYFEQFFAGAPPPPPPPTGSNILPLMTGPTTGEFTMDTTDFLQTTSFFWWKAGDRNSGTFYHCNSSLSYPRTLPITWITPRSLSAYKIKPRDSFPAQAPKTFVTEVHEVGGGWVVWDNQPNATGYATGAFKSFTPATAASTIDGIRFVVAANGEGSVNLSIGDIELIGS